MVQIIDAVLTVLALPPKTVPFLHWSSGAVRTQKEAPSTAQVSPISHLLASRVLGHYLLRSYLLVFQTNGHH